jgi:hypothetical protein
MIRTKLRIACLTATILVGSGGPLAAAEPEAPPPPPAPIDWRDFIDSDKSGDHVVGEELCHAPDTGESVPVSFAVT